MKEPFYKAIINEDGLTIDELLRWLSKDYATHNGMAMHVNYNANYKIADVRYIPFRDCRLISPDSETHQGKIAVYDDWGRRTRRNIKTESIQYFDKFNPDPLKIEKQVEDSGGWENYKGQLLWFSNLGKDYPLTPFDSVSEDIETDSRIKSHKRKKAATGFNLDYIFVHKGKFENDHEREKFLDVLEDQQGDTGSGMMLCEAERDEQIPQLIKIDKIDAKGDFYFNNETSVQDNIRKRFGFLPPLVGGAIQGMGISQAITEASNFMNGMTSRERTKIEEIFSRVFSLFHVPINPTNDYSITKLQLTALDIATIPTVQPPAAP